MNKFTYSFLAFFVALFFISACEKAEVDKTTSNFLKVEKKNSSLQFHYSHVDSIDSGVDGYNQFAFSLLQFNSTEVLGTITRGNVGGANNDTIYKLGASLYGVSLLPNFQSNLSSMSLPDAIIAHNNSDVIANSNYELSFTPTSIIVNTTTEFFESVSGEDYYLSAYIMVDSIVANQAGHPDGAVTNHRKVVVDIARPAGYDPDYKGYKIATNYIDKGYKFNLTLEAGRLPAWTDTDQISVALVLTTRDSNGKPVFVNANTVH